MSTLYAQTCWDQERSKQLLKANPDYGVGHCYQSACLGHTRLIEQAVDHGQHDEARRILKRVIYVQGWLIQQFRDGSGVDGFPHGFLLDLDAQAAGQPCVIDAVALLLNRIGDWWWTPVQRFTWHQVERYIDSETTSKAWPLTWGEGRTELEERWSYQHAYNRAAVVLTAPQEVD